MLRLRMYAHTGHGDARNAFNAASRMQAKNAHTTGHENARDAFNAASRIQATNAHECTECIWP